MNEHFIKKLIKLNVVPQELWTNKQTSITLFENLMIFETKNLDFKELINKKFKNMKNIIFENYYFLIVF